MKTTEHENLRVFVNASQNITAIHKGLAYEFEVGALRDAFAIVETWLRGGSHVEFCTEQQRKAANAIRALILSNCTVGTVCELDQVGSPKLKMLNANCNPSGRAGSSQWAICR